VDEGTRQGDALLLPAARLPTQRGAVRIGVRPEKIFIEPRGGGTQDQGDNSIEAMVEISTYTGVSTSYECSTTDGSKVVVYVQNMGAAADALAPGSKVRLSWHPEHTFAVEQDSSTTSGANE
ncbi:MAG: TOBE domain-containing protein, partial [Actinomycetota bacterium]|nr:TOBE domain-containing protein [Actinomycetota bacterium]